MPRKGGVKENLKPFVKGDDPRRNLKGAPPVLPELKEALKKILEEEKDGITNLEAVLKALFQRANKGDVRAIQELLDRFYGKVKQDVGLDVTSIPKLPDIIIKSS